MRGTLFFILFLTTLYVPVSGQVHIGPDSMSIRNNTFGDFAFLFRENSDRRRYRINYFAHSLWHNSATFNMADDEYWHLGARNSGDFDLAFGPLNEDNFVDLANSLVTFKQDGSVGIGIADPEDRLHVAGGDVQISDTNPRLDIISDGTNDAVLGFGDNGGGADATIVYDSPNTRLTLSTIASAGNIILDRKVGVNEINDLTAQMTIKANSGTVSTPVQLELRENNNSDFARMRFSQFSVDGYWDVAGVAEPDGSQLGDPKMNFYYYTGSSGSNIMSLDGDDQRVGINKTTPDAFLHVDQSGPGIGLIIENNGAGNDQWGFEVGTNDLTVSYDGATVGFFNDATGAYTATSDRRFKNTIEPLRGGTLQKVMQLRPVSYFFNHDQEKVKPTLGFIAQEVQSIEPVWVTPREDDYLGINYDEFIPVLTKAIQEQQKLIEDKDRRIAELENRLADMEDLVNRLVEHVELPAQQDGETILLTDAELFQNEPNPFDGRTLVRYRIPDDVQQATLRITNAQGQVVRDLRLDQRGAGQVELNAQILSSGAYQYSLILDGRLIDTKRMIRQK